MARCLAGTLGFAAEASGIIIVLTIGRLRWPRTSSSNTLSSAEESERAGLDDRLQVLDEAAEAVVVEAGLVALHPVDVAQDGVDLAVVGEHAERLGQLPVREGVGRIALVEDREARDEALVEQVGIEGRQMLGEEHALVDDRAAATASRRRTRRCSRRAPPSRCAGAGCRAASRTRGCRAWDRRGRSGSARSRAASRWPSRRSTEMSTGTWRQPRIVWPKRRISVSTMMRQRSCAPRSVRGRNTMPTAMRPTCGLLAARRRGHAP